ncbi:uncharacterized protein LOC141538132 [Cotesia typhae]|uniref:uncharacterized protein LOC141538132 n=1 Tax=Cotesia typhae TaxID=2053667 RepID=UPI003D680459
MTGFPVLVINKGFKAKIIKPYFSSRYPTYVLAVHYVNKLKTTLQEFATLSTWSIESIFFVVRYSEINCDVEGRKATLFPALNVSSVVNIYRSDIYSKNVSLSASNFIISGTYDICLDIMFISTPGYELVDVFDPNFQNELFILSHKNGAQMPIENSPYAWISSIVIVSFFVLLLSYTPIIINEISNLNNCNAADVDNDPEYGNSFLDTLSFIVNAGMMTPLNSLSMRVMFVVTTLLVFIVSPDIQGNLISATTTQEYSYPKSIKNLFDLKYNVYINPNLRNTFINKKDDFNTSLGLLHSPIRSIYKCHERILYDPTTACVFLNAKQIEIVFKYDFPLTMIFEIDKYLFFWSRKNWPLKKKSRYCNFAIS